MIGKLVSVKDAHTNQPRTDAWHNELLGESYNLYLRVVLPEDAPLGNVLLMEQISYDDNGKATTRLIETSTINSVCCGQTTATFTTRNSEYTFQLPFELELNKETQQYEMTLQTVI